MSIAIVCEDWSIKPYRNDDGSLDIYVKYGNGAYEHKIRIAPTVAQKRDDMKTDTKEVQA